MEKFLKNLTVGKVVALLLLLGVVVLVFVLAKKKIKSFVSEVQQKNRLEEQIAARVEATGETPSYIDSEYETFANSIYNAVKGAGTDEDAVCRVLDKMKNDADMLKLEMAFGIRDGMDLRQWIRDDFSTTSFLWMTMTVNDLNSTLNKRGISYQF